MSQLLARPVRPGATSGARQAHVDARQGDEALRPDLPTAAGAPPVGPLVEARERPVQQQYPTAGVVAQGDHLGPLEGDGGTLGVVLVVGVHQLGPLDVRVEVPRAGRELLGGIAAGGGEDPSVPLPIERRRRVLGIGGHGSDRSETPVQNLSRSERP